MYAEGILDLVPEVYRADIGEKEQNDNKILAVVLRYKRYSGIPVIFITDDRSLSNKASGEGIEVWTAKDFLAPPESSFEEPSEAKNTEVTSLLSEEAPEEILSALEMQQRTKVREDFLTQKISAKLLHLEASQISVLQNNGIKTVADFLAQTESSFASMKVKKGVPFVARFLIEQEHIRRKLKNL